MKGLLLAVLCFCGLSAGTEEDERLPNKCEVCKFLTTELQEALEKTGRSKEVLEVGEVLDTGKRRRKIKYNTSETRLTEAVDNICERILQYNVHAERPGSLRYAKGSSQTMTTLKNLVNKGVKVDLGMPYELWDEPSAEVTNMKKQCETMLEQYEEVVEDWYFHHQDQRLERFLCENHILKTSEQNCLKEMWKGDPAIKEALRQPMKSRERDMTLENFEGRKLRRNAEKTTLRLGFRVLPHPKEQKQERSVFNKWETMFLHFAT